MFLRLTAGSLHVLPGLNADFQVLAAATRTALYEMVSGLSHLAVSYCSSP